MAPGADSDTDRSREMGADTVVAEVGRRMLVAPAAMFGRRRSSEICDARHAAWLALSRLGASPTYISRMWRYNHSSIVHGLARAAGDPHMSSVADDAALLCGLGGVRRQLHLLLARGLAVLEPHELVAVEAYCCCTLLGWERRPPLLCAYGLLLTTMAQDVRPVVDEALIRCDQAAAIGLIDLQARHAGYLKARA